MFNDCLTSFLSGSPDVQRLYGASFLSKQDRYQAVARAKNRLIDPVIISELRRLNTAPTEAQKRSLDLLEKGSAVAVLTGQQLGCLGGPLFTLYKALTCAKFAAQLQDEVGSPVVPIFWLQGEDHDFAEIRSANFISDNEELIDFTLEDQLLFDSVGDRKVTENDARNLSSVLGSLSGERDPKWIDILKNSYKAGASLTTAFRDLMNEIVGNYGILFFNPHSRIVKSRHTEFISSCFLAARTIELILTKRAEELESLNLPVQVKIKDKSPLFFFSDNGRRERLVESREGCWVSDSNSLTKENLYKLLSEEPERFTCSALIRPIFQDKIFPTVAYIAGPSEFNYFAQIGPLYNYFSIPQPLVVPRPSFIVLDRRYSRLLDKINIGAEDINLSTTEFIAKSSVGTLQDPVKIFGSIEETIKNSLHRWDQTLLDIDPNLTRAIEQTESSMLTNLSKLRGKYERALQQKEEIKLKQFQRIKNFCFPNGSAQERIIGLADFISRYGEPFIKQIYQSIEPTCFSQKALIAVLS